MAGGSSGVAAPEALEHSLLGLRSKPVPRVLDRHLEPVRPGLDEHGDRAVGGRVTKRVGDDVGEDALDLLGRAPRDGVVGDPRLELDPARPGLGLEPVQARIHHAGKLGPAQLERQRARVDPRHLEQVVHQDGERSHLLPKHGQ